MNFVAHHQCFKNRKATENVVKSFRETNPSDPYVLWSDKGDDYTDLAEKYNIKFVLSEYNVGAHVYKGKEQIFNFFDRIRKTCEMFPDKPYVIWVEDDVLFKGKIKIPEGSDFCGWANIGNSLVHRFGKEKFNELCKKYNVTPNFDYYTAAGGTVLSSDVFTNKFSTVEKYIEEDYTEIQELISERYPDYEKRLDYDVEFMMIHLVCGKQYSVWNQITECHKNPNWMSDQYTVIHGYKEYY